MTILGRIWSFSKMNIAASVLLFFSAILAAVIANSPFAHLYNEFLQHELHMRIGEFNLLSHGGEPMKMIEFINDGLMTIFFFLVGLEIKREVLVGELSSLRKALLPFIAACGGMFVPMAVYSLFCAPGTPEAAGVTIPMATDIAFSLGVLSLLGNRVPVSLKIFLTAFAVVDDIGGIIVIAVFYSSHISLIYLLVAAILYAITYFLSRHFHMSRIFYFVIGFVIWYLFMQSGIHSTIAGVILAFVVSARPRWNVGQYIEQIRETISGFPVRKNESIVLTNAQIERLEEVAYASQQVISPLQALEDNLKGAVNYLILPLFAFVNAGVVMSGGVNDLIGNVSLGVGLGLILGKFLGIYSFTWLSIRSRLTPMPDGMTWKNLSGVAMLGGIGFTVSLFIDNLSFGDQPDLLNQAKLGVLIGSVVSGILGYLLLRSFLKEKA